MSYVHIDSVGTADNLVVVGRLAWAVGTAPWLVCLGSHTVEAVPACNFAYKVPGTTLMSVAGTSVEVKKKVTFNNDCCLTMPARAALSFRVWLDGTFNFPQRCVTWMEVTCQGPKKVADSWRNHRPLLVDGCTAAHAP